MLSNRSFIEHIMKKSLFERKMADKKSREEFKKKYPLFELEVQALKASEECKKHMEKL